MEPDRTAASPAPRDASSDQRRRFDTVLRGYDRMQVEEYLARVDEENALLRRERAEADRRRQIAEQHASATENEFRALRTQHQEAAAPEGGFGFRAEKLLRLAEQEAIDVRTAAAREASMLLERARADAEQHRHEVEQSLIARSALLDEQAAQRTAELQERERQLAEQLTAARHEAQTLHDAARKAADQQREQADAAAEALRMRMAQEGQRLREQAQHEVARLGGVQHDLRAELGRLAELLASALHGPERGGPERGGPERGGPERGGPERDGPGAARGPSGAAGPTRSPERHDPADEGRDRRREPVRTAGR